MSARPTFCRRSVQLGQTFSSFGQHNRPAPSHFGHRGTPVPSSFCPDDENWHHLAAVSASIWSRVWPQQPAKRPVEPLPSLHSLHSLQIHCTILRGQLAVTRGSFALAPDPARWQVWPTARQISPHFSHSNFGAAPMLLRHSHAI